MKKSLLYSILMVVLLGGLVMTSVAIMQRQADYENMLSESMVSTKLKQIENTIAVNFIDIMEFEIIDFSKRNFEQEFILSREREDPSFLLNEYTHYIENYYAQANNLDVMLNLSPNYILSPFKLNFTKNHYLHRSRINKNVSSIYITAELSDGASYLNNTNESYESGETELFLKVLDSDGQILLERNRNIEISGDNFFSVSFNSSDPKPLFFVNITNSIMDVTAYRDIEAEVNLRLEMENADKSKIYLNAGGNTIIRDKKNNFSGSNTIRLTAD
ncbi:MAG: hypothetical protein ACOCZ6_01215 [Nanoarchaeota archaeon]